MSSAADAVSTAPSPRSAVLVAIVGFSVLAAVTVTRSRPPQGFAAGGMVAWNGAANRTSDRRLGSAALGALEVALSQSRMVRLVANSAAGDPLRLDLVIDGAGTEMRLRATVRDEAGRRFDSVVAVGPFLAAVDDLADQVRHAFGERRTERTRASAPVARLGSGSIDALAAYGDALAAEARHDEAGAVAAGRTAIAADSGFAQSWLLAGRAAGRAGVTEGPAWLARGEALLRRGPRNAPAPF